MLNVNLHSRRCLAASVIAAVENLRDDETMTDGRFAQVVQTGEPGGTGLDYLETGLMTCTCHVGAIRQVKEAYDTFGPQRATDLAGSLMQCGYFGPETYIQLVRWSEGRPSSV